MISGGDSILAQRLHDQIKDRIEKETAVLIADVDRKVAGRVEALKDVLAMIGTELDTLHNPEKKVGR